MAVDSLLYSVKPRNDGSTSDQQQRQHQSIMMDLNEITHIPTDTTSPSKTKADNNKKKNTLQLFSSSGLDIITPLPKTKVKESKRRCCRHCIKFLFILCILVFSLKTYHTWLIQSFATMKQKENVVDGIGVGMKSEESLGTKFDLNIGKVDHWCLNGDNDSCSCLDPTEAVSRITNRPWFNAHESNQNLIKDAVMAEYLSTDSSNLDNNDGVDVVFLGDSITEEWNGRWLGRNMEEELGDIKEVFGNLFEKKNGGKVEGLALGIAGDGAPNLLWRIQNGEMPDNLNPSVWWILIGTNDFGIHHCSGEIVFMGIQRIIEEIMHRKPDATKIVINSILPRTTQTDGKLINGTVSKDKIPDLWPRIDAVNNELKYFCKKHEQLEFFDAGYIFLGKGGNEYDHRNGDGYIMSETMKDDHLHPTALGHKLWGLAIVKKLREILNIEEADEEEIEDEEINGDDDVVI